MKKLILLIALLLSSNYNVFSQSGWFWQNPLPQGNTLKSVKYINASICFAVGTNGTIIKSTNNGVDWITIRKNTGDNLNSICSIDTATLVAIGSPGLLLKTTNVGENWISLSTPQEYSNSVCFVDQDFGYIAGYNSVIKTSNGGFNWFPVLFHSETTYNDVFFLNQSTGWVSGCRLTYTNIHKEVYKTTNGGLNWSIQLDFPDNTSQESGALFFINEFTGWRYPNYKTTNGGSNWYTELPKFEDIFFVSNLIGWKLSSQSSSIYETNNGGINWFLCEDNVFNITSFDFADTISGVGVGEFGSMILSSNGGNNWYVNSSGSILGNYSLGIMDSSNVWVATHDAIILKSSNSGINWNSYFVGDSSDVTDVFFINNNTGFLTNWNGKILKTTNGGVNWELNFPNNYIPRSVYFVDENTGFVGDLGVIRKTSNCGLTWQSTVIPNAAWVQDIIFYDTNKGWIASDNLYRTTNGGNSWIRSTFLETGGFYKLFFSSADNGWAIKDKYYVYRTTNSGVSWEIVYTSQYGYWIWDIYFWNSDYGIAVGGRYGTGLTTLDIIMKTENGGLNWNFLPAISNEHCWTDFEVFNNSATGWVVGTGGAILKTTNFGGALIGIIPISIKIPSFFSLHQNYPNPFNPVTRIKFDIPKSSNTKILIYDVLGKLVATLVNENLKPGSYEVEWDGSWYASGVYFYSIITDEFVETKRMVLIK